LILLSFILKLIIVTLFYLIYVPATQTNRLQLVLNSAARAGTKTPKFHHITPILKFLHSFKINERIKYKVLSFTYKSLKTGQRSYLLSFLSFLSHRCTRSSSLITLIVALLSPLKIANRSYYHSAPVLWNNLPSHLRQVVHHVTPSPITLLCVIFQPLFSLRSWKPISFTLPFLLSLHSPRLSQD